MLSNHHILCCPLLLLPSIFPSVRVYSNELTLHVRWSKYWSFSIRPSDEYSGFISFRIEFDLLTVQGTLKTLFHHHSLKASIYVLIYDLFFWLTYSSLQIRSFLLICLLFPSCSFLICPFWANSNVVLPFLLFRKGRGISERVGALCCLNGTEGQRRYKLVMSTLQWKCDSQSGSPWHKFMAGDRQEVSDEFLVERCGLEQGQASWRRQWEGTGPCWVPDPALWSQQICTTTYLKVIISCNRWGHPGWERWSAAHGNTPG